MRNIAGLLLVLLAACANDETPQTQQPSTSSTPAPAPANPTPDPSPSPTPSPTPSTGTPTGGPVVGGELANCGDAKEVDVPADGISFLLNVDTSQMQRAHLGAGARALVVESPASFLVDVAENGTTLQAGWDVCVGQTDTSCFANVEMDPGIGVRTFKLNVRPKTASAAARAKVSFCVLDPLEK
jgi:hypothetical protein